MRDAQPRTIFLKEYRPPDYLIEHTDLHFDLFDEYTIVTAQLTYRLSESGEVNAPMVLHGSELELEYLAINGIELEESRFAIRDEMLQISDVPERGRIESRVRIKPQDNTSLEGLYRSRGLFCTQCEAEGFRKITWFPDRPDVMSVYRVTIDASANDCPELLSNGNLVHQQELPDGRHRAVWEDPFPKPSYLFALVAGTLSRVEDEFVTMSGRRVRLVILVEEKDLDKCAHAMDSLKRSMKWDEERFGREYDLDVFHIVAVDDFNMGAMENKSLNVFNTSCVLASPETTTDQGYQRVEAVVAHEYFHNWSGNRVTCRDWFQLSLKEGFTVFRDAEFSSDMGSRALKRVEDAGIMRTMQFAEDAGPMAHPIRPDSFIEISNFYTLTVYEKGAEVVRMYHTLLGEEIFRKGSDLYFDRHDGQAVTCDDFVSAMEDASGMDFSHFKLWYSQAGTPELTVKDHWDESAHTYALEFEQHTPPTPGQASKQPLLIPLAMGLLGAEGNLPLNLGVGGEARVSDDQLEAVLMIDQESQRFEFEGVSERPIPSLLRGFSAPIRIEHAYSRDELAALASRDADGFVRWDAMQQLLVSVLDELQATAAEDQGQSRSQRDNPWTLDVNLAGAFTLVAEDRSQDPAIRAETLRLPSESYLTELASHRGGAHPHAIRESRNALRTALASALSATWETLYAEHQVSDLYAATGEQIGRRSLANLSLAYFSAAHEQGVDLAIEQYRRADNLSNRLAALRIVLHEGSDEQAADLLNDFYERFGGEALALNHWFQVQAERTRGDPISRVQALMEHPAYDAANPNKIRALVGGFANLNTAGFHREDGAGYRLLGAVIEELNERNPQIASRLLTPLTRWRFYPVLGEVMRAELDRLAALPSLSRDVYEVVNKSLAG
ncbi:MAG: aminopeptidase N [Pseudomonadota bacterium]